MKLSRRTNTIILWIIAIALLVGMIIMFTPTMGNPFASVGRDTSTPVLAVNGEAITELEVARAQQNRLYSAINEGEAAQDLQFLMLDTLVEDELLRQASARTRVSSAEVRDAVNEWRAANQVAGRANDQRYLSLIRQMGYEDATFRREMEAQLRQQRYIENAAGEIDVTEEEVRAFYDVNQANYATEERIRARQIVVEDQQLASELHARALAGEEFAALAQEYSVERADRAGALGAVAGSTEPVAIGRNALPTPVANEAFALQGEGITNVVNSGGRYYIVQVEEYIPSGTRPFEEVREQVREEALNAKRQGEQERLLESLRAQANITVPAGSPYTYENPVVATVGDEEIRRSELVRYTYLNPQIQQFLRPDTASLITDFFKPNILEQLIDQKLAYQGAQELDVELIGTEAMIAQGAESYITRDVDVSEEAVREYYETNRARFTVPASAVATRVTFDTETAARDFRTTLLEAEAVDDALIQEAAQASGGTAEDLGTVRPGDLPTEYDTLLFLGNGFEPLEGTEREVSDIIVVTEEVAAEPAPEESQTEEVAVEEATAETDEAEGDIAATGEEAEVTTQTGDAYVVLVATRTPERIRPLEEVRAQVENAVEQNLRQQQREAWLSELRAEIPVVNMLETAPAAPVFDPSAPEEDATETQEPGTTADITEAESSDAETAEDPSAEVDVTGAETILIEEANGEEAETEAEDAELETTGSTGVTEEAVSEEPATAQSAERIQQLQIGAEGETDEEQPEDNQ